MGNIETKYLLLVPECNDKIIFNKGNEIPFSLSYFLNCTQRLFARENHFTLNGDEKKKLSVLLSFFS
jgi:hypothetical protein